MQGSDYLSNWFGKGKITKLSLDEIDPKHISFTFGDSMAKMDKPERKAPFLVKALWELVDSYGDITELLNSIKDQYEYIEVQLWSDEYIKV